MAWSARALAANWAPRQRQSDAERIRDEFESVAEHVRSRGAAPFDFQAEMSRLRESLRARDGWYSGEAFRGPIARIPEAFAGLI
jgi:hypothetical protein